MGTRNLTMVIDKEGNKKIAQYGQWDGYPSGVGVGVLRFLKNEELVKSLISNLSKVRFLDQEGRDKAFYESYEKNTPNWSNEPDNRTGEQKRWWDLFCSRNLAEEVLTNIAVSQDDEIMILDRENTAKGDGWVEYSYVIDFSKNTLTVYEKIDLPYLKEYDLNNLPSEDDFISGLEEAEELANA